ncbi:MAG: hypothetical protein J6E46_04760 [Faecalicoccus sp.]|nr:hypothetical protein [Faecalicoccus sp.]
MPLTDFEETVETTVEETVEETVETTVETAVEETVEKPKAQPKKIYLDDKERMAVALESIAEIQNNFAIHKQTDKRIAIALEKLVEDGVVKYNDLVKVMNVKGSVANYADLPSNPKTGDMYNIVNADPEHEINAGDNVVWLGEAWDNFGGYISSEDLGNKWVKDVDGDGATSLQGVKEGNITGNTVTGMYGHAEGSGTSAGYSAHAEGSGTSAGYSAHAEGNGARASGYASHAEGYSTASGEYSHSEGMNTTASGNKSHAEGFGATASGENSHAEGSGTTASGNASHAEGRSSGASGLYSHAEGDGSTTGDNATGAHAEGYSRAEGSYAHSEGSGATASGAKSHAEGNGTTASGINSHAEGNGTTASGVNSHAEGQSTLASYENSHAEGYSTTASGQTSHAEGEGTTAARRCQHVFGSFNISDSSGSSAASKGAYIEIVGNGTAASAKSNARTLDWNGNETLKGKLTIGADPVNAMDVVTKGFLDSALGSLVTKEDLTSHITLSGFGGGKMERYVFANHFVLLVIERWDATNINTNGGVYLTDELNDGIYYSGLGGTYYISGYPHIAANSEVAGGKITMTTGSTTYPYVGMFKLYLIGWKN